MVFQHTPTGFRRSGPVFAHTQTVFRPKGRKAVLTQVFIGRNARTEIPTVFLNGDDFIIITASSPNRNRKTNNMAKKTVDWMKKQLDAMISQFDQFTIKLPSYQVQFGITAGQCTAIRNDYLWAAYAVMLVNQFDAELKNRVMWRDHLLNGPGSSSPATVPSIGSEFMPPAPAAVLDGILSRWRKLAEYIKNHLSYTLPIGLDLGIEATAAPAQATKPRFRSGVEVGGKLQFNLLMDGHDSVAVKCQRGAEPEPTLLGIYTRSKIEDDRPNLVPGQPEQRKYIAEYRDADKPVGQPSDVFCITKQP